MTLGRQLSDKVPAVLARLPYVRIRGDLLDKFRRFGPMYHDPLAVELMVGLLNGRRIFSRLIAVGEKP